MVRIAKIGIEDVEPLLKLSRETFFTAFAHLNDPADMQIYAAKAFTITQLTRELSDPDSVFFFANTGDRVVGYIKLNYNNAQTEFRDCQALEVERIYIIAEYQNRRIGRELLDFAEEQGRAGKLNYMWLGVWEHNKKAIGFYERNGFKIFGKHKFVLGTDMQTDLLLKKQLI